MEGFLRVDHATNLPGSPTNSFLADEVRSICPLITPSPPTNDLINSLPDSTEPNYAIGEVLANKLQHVQDDDKCAGDSASSSSSALAEPACAQLLNHRNVYHHINKNEEAELEETNGKSQPLQLTFRNPPDNYFFMSWNWPLIRKIALMLYISVLVAMVALIVAMISSLPKTCNPQTQWYQGSVLYEVFPASFYSDHSMEGDFKGISIKSDYIMSLGVKAVRLNSIFNSPHYPKDYENLTSLIQIAKPLGNLSDFKSLTKHLSSRNISLILDLPLHPFIENLHANEELRNDTIHLNKNFEQKQDLVQEALLHWVNNNVEGFYLKGLEYFLDDPNLAASLRRWKKIVGPERPLIVSEAVINNAPESIINIVLNNVDLVDVKLEIEKGVVSVSKQIGSLQNSTLFTKAGMPWIHWSIGNVNSNRLANVLPFGNATLGATLLELMLPGTASIFYGDEIGLQQILDPKKQLEDIKHLHQLTMMAWPSQGSSSKILPWIYGDKTSATFIQAELISKMTALRAESPSIYMNSVNKEGDNKANAEIKYSKDDFLVIQRWYPRRKSYVVASNLGNSQMSVDLSTLLYSGEIVVGPRSDSKPGSISFKDISLWPGESVVILLD